MKEEMTVNYYDPGSGSRRDATVVEIVGEGESLSKLLNLRLSDDTVVGSVSHGDDASPGEPFWLLKGVERAPDGWADVEQSEEQEPEELEVPLDYEDEEEFNE